MKIYQIESTSKCNAKCSFCPRQKMTRAKEHMTYDTFNQTLKVMENRYCALHHFGEPMLNPNLDDFITLAHHVGVSTEFSTNGGISDSAILRSILDAQPRMIRIAYDYFRPNEFLKKILVFNRTTIIKLHAVTRGLLPAWKAFNNFAGQVPGETKVKGECYFLKYKYVCVLQNGKVVPCCQDFDGKHIIGDVWHPDELKHQDKYKLCETCGGMQFAEDGLWKAE